ncbi:MAG: 50S ribosomal protein L11 methyltransferase [Anaerolineales bacterium]|nr:50S ribosomal protein L11 methyltransferase [Anaerolineales bacterium]
MSGWVEVTVTTAEEHAEEISDVLRPFAEGESVAIEQLGDPNDLAPYAMLPEVHLKIYLPTAQDTPETRQAIERALEPWPCESPRYTHLQDVDWSTAWREHYQPVRVGQHILIQPSWLPVEDAQPDDLVLFLDPGMAFGTGQHATTQLCLQALELYLRPGDALLDVGTGSGILAVAAAKLGARPITGLDVDPNANTAVFENATLNHVADQITMHIGSLKDLDLPQKQWDVVVANILAAILHPLIQDEALLNYARPGGHYIFSGIIAEQEAEFCQRLHTADLTIKTILRQEGWLAIIAQAPTDNKKSTE